MPHSICNYYTTHIQTYQGYENGLRIILMMPKYEYYSVFSVLLNISSHIYLQRKSQRSDEYIRMIKNSLDTAVEQCIEAAGHEYEPTIQKELLRVRTTLHY